MRLVLFTFREENQILPLQMQVGKGGEESSLAQERLLSQLSDLCFRRPTYKQFTPLSPLHLDKIIVV